MLIFFNILQMIRTICSMSSRNKQGTPEHATFSLGADDQDRIEVLRLKLGRQGHLLNRSEVVRLGLLALMHESGPTIDAVVDQLKRLRPGRTRTAKLDRR